MESVLPPNLEAKRLRIARTHNLLVVGLLLGLVSLLLLFAVALPQPRNAVSLLLIAVPVVLAEAYAIYRIISYDKELCRRVGFVCPFCGAPLFVARGSIHVTGLCPKCRRSVISG